MPVSRESMIILTLITFDGLAKSPSSSLRRSGVSRGGGHACGEGRIYSAWRGSHANGVTALQKARRDFDQDWAEDSAKDGDRSAAKALALEAFKAKLAELKVLAATPKPAAE